MFSAVKVIPDMVPNYIAFAKREEAEAFAAKEGGKVIDFNMAYRRHFASGHNYTVSGSHRGNASSGQFSAGMVYGYTQKDNLKISSNGEDPNGFIHSKQSSAESPERNAGKATSH